MIKIISCHYLEKEFHNMDGLERVKSMEKKFEEKVNGFEHNNDVFATQTHLIQDDGFVRGFTAVLFYRGDK